MAKKQVRNSAYYEERLIRDHPEIYADLVGGKYQTITEAAMVAGLKKPRTRLHELKNAWTKASNLEQEEFLAWLTTIGALPPVSSNVGARPASISSGRYLLPATVARINHIKTKRGMTTGDTMGEMGFSKLDASLGNALLNGHGLRLKVIEALEKWLTANASV
ncbi:MAG: hypothetical protein WA980_16095 [Shinella zoogloeoides]|uniref:hypothetical protein n=1 Tax=Shinella zoogloeoides TaxID=352475 RepID=UPI003C766840